MPYTSTQVSACSVGGDHPADGSHVEALLIPTKLSGPEALKETYILMQFCEEHLPGYYGLEDGTYDVRLQIGFN